jgi:3',5'-cyclic AMP phosphodiesterase CpdA
VLAVFAAQQLACDPEPPVGPRLAPASVEPTRAPSERVAAAEGTLVLIGDTQRTMLAERLIGREQNEMAQRALIEKLAREERPALVVHLGDLVSWGSSSSEWEYFDRLLAPITAPIHPVLGNHDYWGWGTLAHRYLRQRFPELEPHTYRALRHGDLGLVLADSNLTGDAGDEQARWFEAEVDGFERDPSVRGVLVFTHHPPFTNGECRASDAWVTDKLLPAFLRSRKGVLLASGHVHGYERFERGGKTFLVSGGGGGPRVKYRVGEAASYPAAYAPMEVGPRPFHYVVIEEQPATLRITVKCIALDGACRDGLLETFVLPLAG